MKKEFMNYIVIYYKVVIENVYVILYQTKQLGPQRTKWFVISESTFPDSKDRRQLDIDPTQKCRINV